ncbi:MULTISPECIES: ABC transporter permease [unclassified Streptomyces]|uniref:ABC transporter permease n=1 Tax=unclassified Streptomyces TaxID=2593676 RepID=UPI0027850E37|nr:ABC transporter permease [Streptomyces sp. B4I13]MDQ0958585.1 ABC-2 type transport system permease protein [Streptomyces sp. B4I13]
MTLGSVLAAARLQLAMSRRDPEHLLVLVTTPLFALIFMSIGTAAGREVTVADAVVAPGLIGLWYVSLDVAGALVSVERWQGRLELLLAAPVDPVGVIFGRVAVITTIGALTFAEAWAVASWYAHRLLTVAEPGRFLLGLVLTCLAMAATAVLVSAFFTISRVRFVILTSLSYPVYILGGVVVPPGSLPEWLRPLTTVVFLSHGSDLLRHAATGRGDAGGPADLLLLVVLGTAAMLVGSVLMARIVTRLRRNGTVHLS